MHCEIHIGIGIRFGTQFQTRFDFCVRNDELRVKLIPKSFLYVRASFRVENGTTHIRHDIRVVASGEQFLCEEVNILLKNQEARTVRLSRREQELLRLIVAGLSNSEIAEKMCLGYLTIKSYRKNLILKLNAHNTAQLVRKAIEEKFV